MFPKNNVYNVNAFNKNMVLLETVPRLHALSNLLTCDPRNSPRILIDTAGNSRGVRFVFLMFIFESLRRNI
jgi:hypothetical protein